MPIPRFDNAEVVKREGRPDKYFEFKAIHSMVAGQTYHVVAFLKTSSNLVFSEPVSFLSLGSEGYGFERFEFDDPIYFGDTITVTGRNFSPVPTTIHAGVVNGQTVCIDGSVSDKAYLKKSCSFRTELLRPHRLHPGHLELHAFHGVLLWFGRCDFSPHKKQIRGKLERS